jgi:DGQHR domain-containing protein
MLADVIPHFPGDLQMSKSKFPPLFVRQIIQHGETMYVASINEAGLAAGLEPQIDTYDPKKNPDGYQRLLDEARAEDCAKYVSGTESLIPNPILVNYRTEDGVISFRPTKEGSPIGTISFSKKPVLWNFDGQYRQSGFYKAYHDGTLVGDFELPMVICNLSRQREKELFLTLNATQKGVPTDLLIHEKVNLGIALGITSEHFKSLPRAITKDIGWQTPAMEMCTLLATKKSGLFTNNIWNGRLRPAQVSGTFGGKLPNEKYWFSKSKMVTYIRPVATNSRPDTSYTVFPEDLQERAGLVSNAWRALAAIYPAAFSTDTKLYWLCWTHINIELFYKLLPWVMRHMIESKSFAVRAGDIPTPEDFEKVFRQTGQYKGTKKCEEWWQVKPNQKSGGQVRHFHGRANTLILLEQFKADLGYTTPPLADTMQVSAS